jgi:hypothetical protein
MWDAQFWYFRLAEVIGGWKLPGKDFKSKFRMSFLNPIRKRFLDTLKTKI